MLTVLSPFFLLREAWRSFIGLQLSFFTVTAFYIVPKRHCQCILVDGSENDKRGVQRGGDQREVLAKLRSVKEARTSRKTTY